MCENRLNVPINHQYINMEIATIHLGISQFTEHYNDDTILVLYNNYTKMDIK